jgi:NADH-quinone oxidoreductase subunit A
MVVALGLALLLAGRLFNPGHSSRVKRMPYESGMDPVHDTRRRFDVRFHLLAIAFLVFDVELLFLYPWAIALRSPQSLAAAERPAATSIAEETQGPGAMTTAEQGQATVKTMPDLSSQPAVRPVFAGGMLFLMILVLGFVYDWRKGVFQWR